MAMQDFSDLKPDAANLYREETFTDMKIGSIQRMIPVKVDGSDDESRKSFFVIRTQLMSQMGPLPIQAPVEVETLAEAIDAFPQAVQSAVEKMVEEAEAAQREKANQIIVPGGRNMPPDLTLV